MAQKYLRLRGDFYAAERLAGGAVAPYAFVGNVPKAGISMSIETIKLKSSGNTPGTLAEEETDRSAELAQTLNSVTAANLARVLFGNVVAQTAAEDVAVDLGDLAAGDTVLLPRVNVLAGTFGSLVEGTDYTLDKKGGMFTALTALTDVTGTIDCGAAEAVGLLVTDGKEYSLRFVSNRGVVVDLYRWKPSPASNFPLVSDEFAEFEISGTLLLDETKPADAELGRYGAIYTM